MNEVVVKNNTSLAAAGALPNCLQRCTTSKIENRCQLLPKWQAGAIGRSKQLSQNCQTPVLGLGLGVDFTFANNNKNKKKRKQRKQGWKYWPLMSLPVDCLKKTKSTI